ncbi:60S ribosomal protein L17-2-like protein [Tanacetum coccineum]
MDKDVGLICMLNLFLIFKNADIDAEVKGWMWMLFTSFTSRRTKHKNTDVVHLVLTKEIIPEHISFKKLFVVMLLLLKVVVTLVDDPVVDANHMFNVVKTRETAHALCGMPLIKAKRYLEDVLEHKQAILFTCLCRGNADINTEVKGWMWMFFTTFTSRRTKHKNKDVVHLLLTEELTEYLPVLRPPSTEEHHNKKLLEGDLHCFKNADIDAEVKGWIWMLFTSFTSRRTKHKNKDVIHLVLMEEITEYLLVSRPPSTKEHHNEKLIEGDLHCFENIRVTAHALHGMALIKAKRYLEDVLAHKQATMFTPLCHGNTDIDAEISFKKLSVVMLLQLKVVITLVDDPVVDANHMFNVVVDNHKLIDYQPRH